MKITNKKSQGIIISIRDYREYDRLFSIISKEKGKETFIAKSVRKQGAKLCSILNLWNTVSLDIVEGKNWKIVRGGRILNSRNTSELNENDLYVLMTLTFLLDKIVPEHYPSPDVYEWFAYTIKFLYRQKQTNSFFIHNLHNFLRLSGYEFNVEITDLRDNAINNNKYIFNLSNNQFCLYNNTRGETGNQGELIISKAAMQSLKSFSKEKKEYATNFEIGYNMTRELLSFYSRYYKWHMNVEIPSIGYYLSLQKKQKNSK